ncbi:MAG TPA: ATP-binding protein [Roseiflexaceae bacterium]|nr:ATP-binding protein [Roseiflexaceae bacterium]
MWRCLRRWLSDTPIQDPLEQRQAFLLQVILLGLTGIFAIASVLTLLEALLVRGVPAGELSLSAVPNLLAALVCLAPLALLRRGRFHAAVVLTIGVFFVLAGVVLAIGGLYNSGILLAITPVILAALLLPRRALLATFGGSVLLVSATALAQHGATPRLHAPTIIGNFTLLGGVLALFLDRFGSSLRRALAATLEHEQQLVSEIAARAQAEERLKQSEARLRALFENTNEAIWSVDRDYRLLTFNSFFREQFLLAFGKRIEVGMGLADLLPADAAPELHHYWRQLYDGALAGEIVRGEQQYDIQGQRRYYVVSLYPISADGAITGVSVFSRDITERKRLEAQLLQAQKMEGIGRLAGGVAHDFNNLLTAIIGNAQLALESLPADHEARAEVAEIAGAAFRASALTRQLLAFARRQIIEPHVIDLNQLVLGMDALLRRLIGEDIELVTMPGPALWSVRADPGQIEQVIVNMAVNARDAMPRGGKLTIETRNVALDQAYARQHLSVVPGSYVLLAVSDTGEGMDEQVRERIFEPFFTTKEQGRGTGLGLATCYGIVKQHGGYIWVYSEPGHGTSFKIYLPRADEPAEGLPHAEEPRAALHGGETILLVEDEAAVRALAARVLRAQGYTVLEAAHPDEALAIAAVQPAGSIHLLLTDVVMPGMSGRALAEELLRRSPGIKALFISGYTDNAIVHHGRLDPGVAFLPKPFAPATLARRVREILDS